MNIFLFNLIALLPGVLLGGGLAMFLGDIGWFFGFAVASALAWPVFWSAVLGRDWSSAWVWREGMTARELLSSLIFYVSPWVVGLAVARELAALGAAWIFLGAWALMTAGRARSAVGGHDGPAVVAARRWDRDLQDEEIRRTMITPLNANHREL